MNTVASTAAGTRALRRGAVAAPRPPRRVSGPSRPASTGRRAAPTLAQRATGVADARLLDRLIRGRAWIAVIGAMLMGLVFVQVSMLRLNTGIGRDVATASQLERDNQALRNQVATLGAGDRIETAAARLGMVMPAAGQVHYVHAGDVNARTAALAVSAPAPVVQQPGPGGTPATVTSAAPATTQAVPATAAAPAATATPPAATTAAAPAQTTAAAPAAQQAPAQTSAAPPTVTGQPASTGGAAPTP